MATSLRFLIAMLMLMSAISVAELAPAQARRAYSYGGSEATEDVPAKSEAPVVVRKQPVAKKVMAAKKHVDVEPADSAASNDSILSVFAAAPIEPASGKSKGNKKSEKVVADKSATSKVTSDKTASDKSASARAAKKP